MLTAFAQLAFPILILPTKYNTIWISTIPVRSGPGFVLHIHRKINALSVISHGCLSAIVTLKYCGKYIT